MITVQAARELETAGDNSTASAILAGYEPGELEAAAASSRLEQEIINHPALEMRLQRLRLHQARSLKLFNGSAQPSHLLIVTRLPGAGKSTLLKEHKKRFDNVDGPNGRTMPMVIVEMPTPCTRKGLVENIMLAMGHEPSADAKTSRIIDEIANFARRHGVLMIAIDEADRIFGSEQPIIAKFLVSLLNALDCQLVLAGSPEILQLNRGWGLERRKEVDLTLSPYRYSSRDGQMRFRAVLGLFEKNMKLPGKSDLNSFSMGRRMYAATGGHIGLVSKLLVEALKRAVKEGRTEVNLELLGDVFAAFKREQEEEEDIGNDCDAELLPQPTDWILSTNPFLCDEDKVKSLMDQLDGAAALSMSRKDELGWTRVKGTGKSS